MKNSTCEAKIIFLKSLRRKNPSVAIIQYLFGPRLLVEKLNSKQGKVLKITSVRMSDHLMAFGKPSLGET
jgi:hypothetical protein